MTREKYYKIDTTPVNTEIKAQSGGGVIINDPNVKISIDYRMLEPGKTQIIINCDTSQSNKDCSHEK